MKLHTHIYINTGTALPFWRERERDRNQVHQIGAAAGERRTKPVITYHQQLKNNDHKRKNPNPNPNHE